MSEDQSPLETIAGGAGVIFGGRVLKVGLLFAVELLVARLLGSTAYGGVVLATVAISVGGLVANLGMPRGLVRKLPYYEDQPAKARGALRAGAGVAVLGGGVVGAVTFLLAPVLAGPVFDDPGLVSLFRIAAVGIPLSVVTAVGLSIARAGRTAKPEVIVNHFVDPIGAVVLVGGLVVAGYGARGAVGGRVLAGLAAAVVAVSLAYRALRFPLRGPTEPMTREMLAFGLPLLFASGASFLVSNTDTVLIGTFLSSTAVGVYNVAFQLRRGALFFYHPLTFLLPPVFSRLDATDRLSEAGRLYQVITKWTVFATTPVFLGVVFFPRTAISLTFGPEYVGGATALRILAVSVMVTVAMGANEKALVSLGHNRISLWVNVAVAALNVALNLAVIPRFGIEGAAVASAAAFAARDLLFSAALYRREGIQPLSRSMLGPYAGVLLLSVPAFLAFTRLFPTTAASVVAAGIAFLVAYPPAVVLLGGLEAEDERLLSLVEEKLGVELARIRGAVRWLLG